MNITLRQIQAFLAVVELGSFTRAADRLGISQPALSQLVRELEGQLGMRLIDRTSRRTEVAVNAVEFEQAMRSLMLQFSGAVTAATNLASLKDGRLCIAAPPTFSTFVLPPAIAEFKKAYPGVHLELIDTSEAIEDLVANGVVDLGLGTFSAELDAIDRTVLMRDSLQVFVSLKSPIAKKKNVTWRDVSAQPRIGLTLESGVRRLVDTIFVSNGIDIDYAFTVRSMSTVLSLVDAGLGVAVLPSYALALKGERSIVAMPLSEPSVTRDICLIKRRGRSLSPAAKRFSATVRKWTRIAFPDNTESLRDEGPPATDFG